MAAAGAPRKPRFLCLHGFRTSGEILTTQINKWPESVLRRIDLVYPDGPFPAEGKSDVEGIFDPPYYEWFQFNKVDTPICLAFGTAPRRQTLGDLSTNRFPLVQEFTEYTNFDECLEYIEDCIVKHGPIDGLLGFSQVHIDQDHPLPFSLPYFESGREEDIEL